MITKEYSRAYKEVIEILKYVPEKDVAKIPQEKLDFYEKNMDPEYNYKIDEKKEFKELEIMNITKAILANIFRDYWATPYQKVRIEEKEKYDLNKLEEEKRERYNPNNIFKNRKIEERQKNNNNNLPVEIKKEKFFKKLICFIRNKIIKHQLK